MIEYAPTMIGTRSCSQVVGEDVVPLECKGGQVKCVVLCNGGHVKAVVVFFGLGVVLLSCDRVGHPNVVLCSSGNLKVVVSSTSGIGVGFDWLPSRFCSLGESLMFDLEPVDSKTSLESFWHWPKARNNVKPASNRCAFIPTLCETLLKKSQNENLSLCGFRVFFTLNNDFYKNNKYVCFINNTNFSIASILFLISCGHDFSQNFIHFFFDGFQSLIDFFLWKVQLNKKSLYSCHGCINFMQTFRIVCFDFIITHLVVSVNFRCRK